MARTRSTFKHPKYQQPDHVLVSKLTNEEVNRALLNVLVRAKSKTFFCVQLRIDNCDNHRRYYIGINRSYENINVAYIHVTPMHRPLLAYLWADGLKIKDLTLEAIRQALIGAEEVNLHLLIPLCRLPIRYDNPTAADDGNQDKAPISDASDLPWEFSRCTNSVAGSLHGNGPSTREPRTSRKSLPPRKRSKEETLPEEHIWDEANEETKPKESNVLRTSDGLREPKKERKGNLFDLQELFA